MAEAGLVISHLFDQPQPGLWKLAREASVWSLRKTAPPGWLAELSPRCSFHWGLGPVLEHFEEAFGREGLDRFLSQTPPELFSFDLGPAAGRHQGLLPLAPPLSRAEIMSRSEAVFKFIRRHYQGPLAAENYNFYPTGLYVHITEPDFIRRYLNEFGLGLVLDLAHGAVSAHNLGLDFPEYLEALPLELTREVHLSRPWLPESPGLLAVDAHEAPLAREWHWLRKLLAGGRLPDSAVIYIEYYRDLAKLAAAQSYLADLLAAGSA